MSSSTAIQFVEKNSPEGLLVQQSLASDHMHSTFSVKGPVNRFHPVGVSISEIPPSTFVALLETVRASLSSGASRRPDDGGGVLNSEICDGNSPASCVLAEHASHVAAAHLSPEILGLVEAFAGTPVRPTEWYGPRIYHRGSILLRHTDRPVTHTFGITMYLDSSDHKPWPIVFERESDFIHVRLKVGEMAIYEGVRLPHFRPSSLDASYYATAFLHYQPASSARVGFE
jgi:hypothetical protein